MTKNFGLSENNYLEIQKRIQTFLKNKTQTTVFVFGSRAKATEKKYSDLDLWIDSTPPMNLSEISELSDIFESSDMPIKIDIVTPMNCFEGYQSRILSERIFWF